GIIYDTGRIKGIRKKSGMYSITISLIKPIVRPEKGMSIAVNGACLTASVIRGSKQFDADMTAETASKTNLGQARTGMKVNIELPLTADKYMSGHIVQGHIDCTGKVDVLEKKGRNVIMRIRYPREFGKYLPEKGSVAIDGISLTAYNINNESFEVSVIPETFDNTIIKGYKKEDRVNLEFDIIGKYVEKFLEAEKNKRIRKSK
ncbi:MAG TPA: riboflavin synthase, partial [Firmicutes bacterium]|nr:riboflavin synthase [Bacillota bacterium]